MEPMNRMLKFSGLPAEFKHSRSRTIGQINSMVHRWRQIAAGYYDISIQRFVKPMSLQQSAINLA